jgi:exo-beta-1,3-glucanase (GH17 family)
MKALAYLRHPISLLAVVSAAIGFIWYVLGADVVLPPSPLAPGEKLGCLSYAPPGGDDAAEVPRAQIVADLTALAPYTSCVRTYRTGAGLDRVPEVARELGLAVLQGVAIGRGEAENRAEIERAVVLSGNERAAVRAFIVGSEVLSRGELRSFELAAVIRQVRERTRLPVSYADRAEIWLEADRIVASVDFVTLHVPLYDAAFPVEAANAARHVSAAHARIASRVSNKSVVIGDAGWPSAGRMREAALPSPVNQARVLTALVTAAKAGKIQLNLFEGIDRDARGGGERLAGSHWGLLQNEPRTEKFRWGGKLSNHPLWFVQATTGVLLAFVVFAAGFLSARTAGAGLSGVKWEPVAIIALGAGAFVGWAVADLALQSESVAGWTSGLILLALAFAVPPLAAAAAVRRMPFEGFSIALDPNARRSAHPIALWATSFMLLVILFAVQSSFALVFDADGREFPFAGMTGPALAFLVLSLVSPSGARRESYAEAGAALALAGAVILIVVNESVLNWQAMWFAAALCALAAACWRAPGAQRR